MTTLLEQLAADDNYVRQGHFPKSTNIIKQSPSPLGTNKNDLCWYFIQTNSKYTLKGHDTDVWSIGRFQQWLVNELGVYAVVVTTKGQVTVVSANHISFEPERPA